MPAQGKDEKEAIENIKEAITAWFWAEDQKRLYIEDDMKSFNFN